MAEVRPVRPGLWLVETRTEDFDVRSAVVAGRTGVVVWDTLTSPRDMAGVAELAPGLPISVVYSHGDWDHVWGTSGLGASPRAVIAHELCRTRFLEEIPETLSRMREDHPGVYDEVELVPPSRVMTGSSAMDLGGLTLELHELPGHTPDTMVGFIPEWNILLAGDAAEAPLPFLNPGSPVAEWVKGLETWMGRLKGDLAPGEETPGHPPLVVPSHGETGGRELLSANVRYLRALLDGRDPGVPEGSSAFYRDTHAENLARVQGL